MALYSTSVDIPRPVEEMFAFFTKPANLPQLAPPDFHMELAEGPELLQLGSLVIWKGRRWGISQKMTQEVTKFDSPRLIVEEQRQGPLPRCVQSHYFEPSSAGTTLREEIDFTPPGGLLGMMITEDFIRKDLDKLFAYRAAKLQELFG